MHIPGNGKGSRGNECPAILPKEAADIISIHTSLLEFNHTDTPSKRLENTALAS
jgi:hypothetical protein